MTVSEIETNPAGFAAWDALHAMLVAAYAPMSGVIDPPSSMATMTLDDLINKATQEDMFIARQDGILVGCLFGQAMGEAYEVGKLAVDQAYRGQGHARALIEAAATHARAQGHGTLQLYARVELTGNQQAYLRMGFTQAQTFTHPGFDRPTALIFRRAL
ncbi:GNAT family N-acetyltransferase [Rhodobacteraceae bacterium N5(2021)]|uniref:GNAT family N-acetyltransferase n=1 Tax=Gymnodinialimonas phycosphaerae TaxID=2841589 RepID=A0A975YGU9_9RHOB|nr:GNAT family N-acetyltransferase [Gymnodinialimonas phycosphaerae]MBY4892062.1 GNAT family N-acetyltransferase [Gymnodinialimonas phycosphaerae]